MRMCIWILLLAAVSSVYMKADEASNLFAGDWLNTDTAASGMTRLSVIQSGGGLQVRGFGKCEPDDCDWGLTPLNLLGFSVDDSHPSWAIASWDFGFSLTHLVIHFEGAQMVAETYTIFKDNSGRANYRSLVILRRR
jgi:hypothetical protein